MFDLFRFDSFFSVWYWALTVVVWSAVCHRTMGVPYDMILRAARAPEVAARVEALARLTAERRAGIADAAGALLAAAGGFGLAVLGTLGFWSGAEAPKAAFMLLFPLGIVAAREARLARDVASGRLKGAALLRRLRRRRATTQGIAVLAILAAAVAALAHPPPGFW